MYHFIMPEQLWLAVPVVQQLQPLDFHPRTTLGGLVLFQALEVPEIALHCRHFKRGNCCQKTRALILHICPNYIIIVVKLKLQRPQNYCMIITHCCTSALRSSLVGANAIVRCKHSLKLRGLGKAANVANDSE